jgi:hypothetical protein
MEVFLPCVTITLMCQQHRRLKLILSLGQPLVVLLSSVSVTMHQSAPVANVSRHCYGLNYSAQKIKI